MEGGEQVGAMETFLKWATDLGITDSSLSHSQTQSSCLGQSLCISHFPQSGGRGLAAANDLTKNQLVLRVPKSALITIQTLLSNDIKHSLCVQRYPNLSSTQRLCVCLLAEMGKGKGSCWYPYLMQIPRCYETLSSFTQFETQALQVDDAIWAAEKAILKAKVEWKEAIVLMKELELRPQFQTFKSWLWASATVSSRTMHVSWDDAGCLCPVGDFFNYAAPGEDMDATETTDDQFNGHVQRLTDAGYEEDADAYCFYARRSYGKGEQVPSNFLQFVGIIRNILFFLKEDIPE
ncbi:hypothetical protein GIB67_006256 [Kingdonia uniflora]|uniref:SET domain-containing protein n=1 Tax=Kingdonia uniflora TaxID=39325 RepID=A0A7J7P651_9MAGN|nr:hypothetical protein GIB67_006256 [Kingdonia uniflora]